MGHFPPAIVTLCASSGGLLPGVPAGAEARRVAAEVFADMSPARLTDLLIMVDELVTDAERHGSRLREVHLCRFDMPAAAHIEVVCTPAASPPRVEPAIAAAALGRLMVEELAVAWGVQREGDDWMTWAEV